MTIFSHKDFLVLGIRESISHLLEEIIEFIESPSKDELSDICFSINRLAGAILGRKYVKVVPFDQMHIDKVNKRIEEYGSFRSKRHITI